LLGFPQEPPVCFIRGPRHGGTMYQVTRSE
jgi:hypothetical protein